MGALLPDPQSGENMSREGNSDVDDKSPHGDRATGVQRRPLSPHIAARSAGVHGATSLVALRDIWHQSFSDYGLLAPLVMRAMRYIGSSRTATEEVHLINEIIIDYWAHVRSPAGASGVAFEPLLRRGGVKSEELLDESMLVDHDASESLMHGGAEKMGE